MVSAQPAEHFSGWVPYRRFSELILVSVVGHYTFALFYGVVMGQWGIALALGGPATLVLGLFPLVKTQLKPWLVRLISHIVLLLNFGGLILAVCWMGLTPATAVWWLVWWPMFVAHLLGVRDGLAWIGLALTAAFFVWFNEARHWVPPVMAYSDNPMLLMQLGFLLIGAGFGVVVRRAHDRYEDSIERHQATIAAQKEALEERARSLEDMLGAVQQANLERTRLFAQISHEVRTPLNGLLGFAQLLQMSQLDDGQARHVAQIRHCGDTMLQIVNDVLDFSRLETQSAELHLEPFNAAALCNEVADMLAPIADQRQVQLRRDWSMQPLWVVGDVLRVKQVLLNLLANAIKFSPGGAVSVRAGLQAGPDGTPCLHVELRDSGIGIPADAMPYLFQPFSKASDNTMREFGGSGLGLAICKRLIDMMQGRIGVQSEAGQGSLFWFEVPQPLLPPVPQDTQG